MKGVSTMRRWGTTLLLLVLVLQAEFGTDEPLSTAAEVPIVRFTDVTVPAGNVTGGPRRTCTCSALFEDYDDDGDLDIFVGNHLWPDLLYENLGPEGGYRFVEVGRRVGLNDPLGERAAEGAVFGDVDNDGDLDLYVLSGNVSHGDTGGRNPATDGLFLNQLSDVGAARFLPGTEAAGITIDTIPCSIAFLDIDNDGWLDIFRQGHHGQTVYRNLGGGRFEDVTDEMGLAEEYDSDAMGIAPADYDNDGDLDIFVGAGPEEGTSGFHVLLRNDGDRFVDVAPEAGVAERDSGFSSSWGDYDNDGDLDLYVATLGLYGTSTRNRLYRNEGNGTFTDVTEQAGVGDLRPSTGAVFADFDNDGLLDIYVLNTPNDRGEGRNTLYRNNGDGSFSDITVQAGVGDPRRGYSLTVGDYDNDGFLDIYVGNSRGEPNVLYRNGGNGHHWLKLRLRGRGAPGSNVSAIGARVYLTANGMAQMREIAPASPGNHQALEVHFGLGDATQIERIEIRWPSGFTQELRDVSADQILVIEEPEP